jgi:hypothetical protein
MTGGLGNQMFQYALYMKLKSQGKEVKFDDINEYRHNLARPIMLPIFGLEYPRATWEEIIALIDLSPRISQRIKRKLFGKKSVEIRERDINFDPRLLENDPAYLTGYFQSEKYFVDIKEDVRKAFAFPNYIDMQFPTDLEQKINEYQNMIKHTEAISIHIRRGDYLLVDELYGGICTDAYYEAAITYMQTRHPDAVFYVFSNDIAWVKKWLENRYIEKDGQKNAGNFIIITGTNEYTGFVDMMLMSQCKHHIIANSSFSWWAAYLNSSPVKTVIAPEKWLNDNDSRDIFTEDMVRISAEGAFL